MKPTIASTCVAIDACARSVNSSGFLSGVVAARRRTSMPLGHVVQRIVRRGLVGDDVDRHALGAAARADRRRRCRRSPTDSGLPLRRVAATRRDRVVEVVGDLVEVAVSTRRASRVGSTSMHQADAVVHRHGERLRAAHAAAAGGEGEGAGAACRRSAWPATAAKVS